METTTVVDHEMLAHMANKVHFKTSDAGSSDTTTDPAKCGPSTIEPEQFCNEHERTETNAEDDATHATHTTHTTHTTFRPVLHEEGKTEFQRKKEGLLELSELETKGCIVKKFTFENTAAEIEFEIEKQRRQMNNQSEQKQVLMSIKTSRRVLLAVVSFLEFTSTKFNPFDVHLTGWGENVMDSISDYDAVFEKLYLKYKNKVEMPPELELLTMVLTSAFMFHISHSFMKSFMKPMGPAPPAPAAAKYASPMKRQRRPPVVVEALSSDDESEGTVVAEVVEVVEDVVASGQTTDEEGDSASLASESTP